MKRFVCLILSVLTVLAALSTASALSSEDDGASAGMITSDEAIAAYEAETGKTVATRRYYFQMPDGVHGMRDENGDPEVSWYNEYSDGAGIFWWTGTTARKSWPGCRAMVSDADQHIYYANLPEDVEVLIWNNGVDGGKDPSQPVYEKARLTVNLFSVPVEPGEIDTMPEGCDNFDGCIFIVKPEIPVTAELYPVKPAEGSWYFYYGDGCYGMYAEDSENFKSAEENCCNPDHFDADGRHVGVLFADAIRGDYDRDGDITVMDATRVQNMLADLVTRPSRSFLKQIDADGDGEMTILDATRIQNVIAELMDMDGVRKN